MKLTKMTIFIQIKKNKFHPTTINRKPLHEHLRTKSTTHYSHKLVKTLLSNLIVNRKKMKENSD